MPVEQIKTIYFTVESESSGLRLDRALTFCDAISSRSQASKVISRGGVKIGDKVLKPSYVTQVGDLIEISLPVAATSDLEPYAFPLDIVHEDEDVIVVNKPAGLVVHPANGHHCDTLVNALIYHCKDLSLGFQENRPGLIHRLDRDTSGILVVAKNELAQSRLAKQFQKKTAKRRYWAIVFGEFKETRGIITSFLARHPTDRKKFASIKEESLFVKGKKATTHFIVRGEHSGLSFVELKLETGRTHQIRIHLSENRHPVVGDETYGGKTRAKSLKSTGLKKFVEEMPRFALHAFELGFVHPRTLQWMHFFAPWPKDLLALTELSGLNIPSHPTHWEEAPTNE